jgi:alpha-galactosidase
VTAFRWGNDHVSLSFRAEDGPIRLVDVVDPRTPHDPPSQPAAQPLVEILTPASGRNDMSYRYIGTAIGASLRYVTHTTSTGPSGDVLEIVQRDEASGLRATSVFTLAPHVAAVRTHTTVSVEDGAPAVLLFAVTSFATGAVISDSVDDLLIWQGNSSWAAEHQWTSTRLRGPGFNRASATTPVATTRVRHEVTSVGAWSAGQYVPAGAAQSAGTGQAMAWQMEHNGGWHWELGENPDIGFDLLDMPPVGSPLTEGPPRPADFHDGAYVALLGPTDGHHQWSVSVDADHSFTSVPVAFSVGASLDDAFGHLAEHRRATRRVHPQNDTLPVIFNDFMDTLNGDPTEAKLQPLIAAAARVGAEYFCIDAGWYDDTAGWWASVGDWQPSTVRFPSGFAALLDSIRAQGMVPGLWLEPEVVGVNSSAAAELPDEAFLQRKGIRIREHHRYLLDLRCPAAREHLDAAVDRLVGDFGVGYFKLDYNVTPGAGTDLDAESVGQGLLEHNRALLGWLNSVLDRHPDLVLENCGSGAMRSDFGMLSVLQLQSTSDQMDPLLNPAIVVGALAHILPEQAGNWSYPQPDMSDDLIAFNMCNGLAGRLYQSGLLHRLSDEQLALVRHGIDVHKEIRGTIAASTPRFPTGLPSWEDPWITVAFDAGAQTYVIAWRQEYADPELELALPHLAGHTFTVEQIYPADGVGTSWTGTAGEATLLLSAGSPAAAAKMYRLTLE